MTPLFAGIPDMIIEWMRIINVFLLTFTALALFVRFNDVWHRSSWGLRIMFFGVFAHFLVGAYASGEMYVQVVEFGARSPLSSAAAAVVLIGLWLSRNSPWLAYGLMQKPKSPNSQSESSGSVDGEIVQPPADSPPEVP